MAERTTVVENTINLDGSAVVRGTAKYIENELSTISSRKSRLVESYKIILINLIKKYVIYNIMQISIFMLLYDIDVILQNIYKYSEELHNEYRQYIFKSV